MNSGNQQFIELKLEYSEPLKLLIEKHLSFDWCKEKLFVPYEFKKSEINQSVKVSIAISNFCVLADEGGKIKKQLERQDLTVNLQRQINATFYQYLKNLKIRKPNQNRITIARQAYRECSDKSLSCLKAADNYNKNNRNRYGER